MHFQLLFRFVAWLLFLLCYCCFGNEGMVPLGLFGFSWVLHYACYLQTRAAQFPEWRFANICCDCSYDNVVKTSHVHVKNCVFVSLYFLRHWHLMHSCYVVRLLLMWSLTRNNTFQLGLWHLIFICVAVLFLRAFLVHVRGCANHFKHFSDCYMFRCSLSVLPLRIASCFLLMLVIHLGC